MTDASFLDTGVALGYCFRDDTHHYRCREYLEENGFSLYISDHVEDEYLNREPDLAEEIADAIRDHIFQLQNSDYEGQLDSMDTSQIRQNMVSGNNNASTSLHEFYRNQLPNFIQVEELIKRLRELARDIEQNAIENRQWLLARTEIWSRENDYSEIDESLSEVPWDDRRICLDAHDVVEQTGEITELATVNPRDLVDEGYRELILGQTALEDVVSLAVRS
ncbi:hypothetical protein CP556_05340 [Natrinema sp. CBA1119]|uniref:hypothetical protein n=1 Tax=Natrinema sp. CBA1119 TaxID=1608465 RepID=UPI000BF3770D|nr:hypothetical protein [Natrinema sp. CBA1119]PGF15602.1 hypothetical protein CP556_05340 [Natrinema sp. CBA1119]